MIFQIRRTYYQDMSIYEGRLKQAGFNLNTVVKQDSGHTWREHRIEINSIEELVKLQEAIKQDLIFIHQDSIHYPIYKDGDPELEIYDDYRE